MLRRNRQALESYPAQFAVLDFEALASSLDSLEIQIQNDILNDIRHRFDLKQQMDKSGQVVILQHDQLGLEASYERQPRRFTISLLSLQKVRPAVSYTSKIHAAGRTQEIQVITHRDRAEWAEQTLENATDITSAAYIALERAYVSAYSVWVTGIFGTVYDIIGAQLQICGYEPLEDRFWLSITSGQAKTFRYHLSGESARAAVKWFIQNPSPLFGALDAVTILLTQDVEDAIVADPTPKTYPTSDDRAIVVEFEHLPTLSDEVSFWLSERALFGSETLGALNLCSIGGDRFDLNCDGAAITNFAWAIDPIRPDLEILIPETFRKYKRSKRNIRLRGNTSTSHDVREIATDVVAKYLAELSKP